ncbi:MAG: hypothetical protein LAO22_20230 [Acidobacteriia bacterium]|nr:hypothetical protein [Terriglobia bacterium]
MNGIASSYIPKVEPHGGERARGQHNDKGTLRAFHGPAHEYGPQLQEALRIRLGVMERPRHNDFPRASHDHDGMTFELATRNNVGQKGECDTHQEHDDQWVNVAHEIEKTLTESLHGSLAVRFLR